MSLHVFITKELLFAYFAGQVTALQKQRIQDWLEDPAHEEFFFACVHEWEMTNPQYLTDVNQAITKFNQDVLQQSLSQLPGQVATPSQWAERDGAEEGILAPAPGKWPGGWLVAAAVALLLGLGGWLFGHTILYKTYQTGYGQIRMIALPDGSQVTLNTNSKLTVPRLGFGEFSRQVSLKGEANFTVVHTPDHRKFVVLTDSHFKVEVLGTEFNVFARKRATKVGLYKGQVKVLYGLPAQQQQSRTLAPGDLMILDESQGKLAVKKVLHPENFAAWQQGRYIFENTPLTEIKAILQENYGLQVALHGPGLAGKTVSGSFQADSVNELLQALSQTLDIRVIRQGTHIVLTGQ